MRGDSREYTAHGAKTFTLMKHKSIRHMHEWRYRDYYNVVGNCDDFQVYRFKKCMREWEAAKDQGSFRLQTSQGRSYFNIKGTVYKSK